MKWIWSYFIVVLYVTLTSAGIMDFPGNKDGSQDNLVSDVENKKVLTPPTTSGLIIDSNGYPGNSNGGRNKNLKPETFPPFFNEVLTALFNQTTESKYEIVPFSKRDVINMQKSDICKIICEFKMNKPPCKC